MLKHLIPKHLGDSWNLRDGFTHLTAVLQFPMNVPNWRRYTLTNGEKSAEFVSVSPIVLMDCRFISEKNLYLASGSPRRK